MKTNKELISRARELPGQFLEVQLGETAYLEDQALAELDAVAYLAVHTALQLAKALEQAEAKLDRVKAIHAEVARQTDDAGVEYTVCKHCTEVNRYGQVRYPCQTIRAIGENSE